MLAAGETGVAEDVTTVGDVVSAESQHDMNIAKLMNMAVSTPRQLARVSS